MTHSTLGCLSKVDTEVCRKRFVQNGQNTGGFSDLPASLCAEVSAGTSHSCQVPPTEFSPQPWLACFHATTLTSDSPPPPHSICSPSWHSLPKAKPLPQDGLHGERKGLDRPVSTLCHREREEDGRGLCFCCAGPRVAVLLQCAQGGLSANNKPRRSAWTMSGPWPLRRRSELGSFPPSPAPPSPPAISPRRFGRGKAKPSRQADHDPADDDEGVAEEHHPVEHPGREERRRATVSARGD